MALILSAIGSRCLQQFWALQPASAWGSHPRVSHVRVPARKAVPCVVVLLPGFLVPLAAELGGRHVAILFGIFCHGIKVICLSKMGKSGTAIFTIGGLL